MNFFKLLPQITYDGVLIRNLFFKYYLITDIPDKYLATYNIKDGETLESIAEFIYGDTELWWVIAFINQIEDVIFDLPISQTAIQAMAKDQSTINGVLDMSLFSSTFDKLETENDAKRVIKVVKVDHLNRVLSDIIQKFNENK